MVVYNFKKITTVPTAQDFIDITLSKTQRKTPTVIHPGYEISRIRHFYMRKVKYTQQNYHDRLTQILDEFPILDEIHPFYADLFNVLYDRDHYKLALGQISIARKLIDSVGTDYCKLLKYGDSLYRCKQLKRAALGRMCTIMKKQASSLAYLEQVRQHLARLPSIDPNTRTLLVCGYPNVGKSSFLNKTTRAEVDVQPYAFTTKSLFVGHTEYQYLRWQVVDTPGILDHPLEERNTIEMQSITALAHLRAAILFFIDISEQCGYSINQQIALFKSIKPLFANKPLLLVCNKIDVLKLEELSEENQAMVKSALGDGVDLVFMSTYTGEGVAEVKEKACDKLLAHRVETKLKSKSMDNVLNRLHLALPQRRDDLERPPHIPTSVFNQPKEKVDTMEEEDEEEQKPFWERGFKSLEWKKRYDLADDGWKFDVIPEIMDGRNIADFIDPDIERQLEELEREEEERAEEFENQMAEDDELPELTTDQHKLVRAIRDRKKIIVQEHRENKGKNGAVIPRRFQNAENEIDSFESHLKDLGIDPSAATTRIRSQSRSVSRVGRKRARSESRGAEEEPNKLQRTSSRSRSRSKTPGITSVSQQKQVIKLGRKAQKSFNKQARKGEGDRVILNMKPKHLFSGKSSGGTAQRR